MRARKASSSRTKNSMSPDAQVLGEFTSALAKVQGERIRAESLYQQAKAGDTAALHAFVDSKLIQEYKTRQSKLEGDYQEGLKTYKPGYPKMQQMEAQIKDLQAKIDQETKGALSALKANYEAALAQENQLASKLKESKQTVLGGQDRSFQYNLLTREVDTNRQLYDSLLQRYKEIGVAGGVGVNNITVVDKAKVPKFPFKPNLTLNLMIAIALGLAAGIGLALLLEHLDDTIKLPEEMEKLLGLPVLGIIPATKVADDAELALTENADPRSPFAEAYRSLRTSLQFSTPEGMPKVLLVTSTAVGEGKSTTALSLATHITQTGKNVLLIDCDLRKASLHKKLGVGNDLGLTNYLAGDAQPVNITRGCSIPALVPDPFRPVAAESGRVAGQRQDGGPAQPGRREVRPGDHRRAAGAGPGRRAAARQPGGGDDSGGGMRRHQPAVRAGRRQAPAQHAHAAGGGRTDQGGYAEPFLRLPRLLLSVR